MRYSRSDAPIARKPEEFWFCMVWLSEGDPDVAILIRVVPANAGTHNHRPPLFFRRRLPSCRKETPRSMGPGVRRDDSWWQPDFFLRRSLPQLEPLDLPRCRLRQGVHHLDP